MDDLANSLTNLLSQVILPNLKSVQSSQVEQIAANDRLEAAIEDLRMQLKGQLADLSAQLTACRAEIAALQVTLQHERSMNKTVLSGTSSVVN